VAGLPPAGCPPGPGPSPCLSKDDRGKPECRDAIDAEKREIFPDAKCGDRLSPSMNRHARGRSRWPRPSLRAMDQGGTERTRAGPASACSIRLSRTSCPRWRWRSRLVLVVPPIRFPVEVRVERRQALAIRWSFAAAARPQRAHHDRPKLSGELLTQRIIGGQRREESARDAPPGGRQPRFLAITAGNQERDREQSARE